MKILYNLFIISACMLFAACGKHPSSLVGVWKTGEQGLFSVQIVLTLRSDGTGQLNADNALIGGVNDQSKWEFTNGQLTFTDSHGGKDVFRVVSKSRTDLVLQNVTNGQILSLKRISDS